MFKFLHAADIHLDSPLRGLQRYEGAPVEEIRQASRRALENLVQLAIDQSVAFVLIAGDLYDGDWKDHRTGLYFVSQMVRLRAAGIPVIAIAGNHDAANKMTRTLPLPENVHVLDHRRPETFLLEQPGVAIHGQSFATPTVLEDLSAAYPPAVGGMLNIGLLHTCATGREGHQPYAPCTIPGLISKHYDYWALVDDLGDLRRTLPLELTEASRKAALPRQPFATGDRPAGRDRRTHEVAGDRLVKAGAPGVIENPSRRQ